MITDARQDAALIVAAGILKEQAEVGMAASLDVLCSADLSLTFGMMSGVVYCRMTAWKNAAALSNESESIVGAGDTPFEALLAIVYAVTP